MTQASPDVCVFQGKTYSLKEGRKAYLNPISARWPSEEFEINPRTIWTSCWRGFLGHFELDGRRLQLRALLGFYWPLQEELPSSNLWVARRPILDWSPVIDSTTECVEYVLNIPRDVCYEHLVLRGHGEYLQFPEDTLLFSKDEQERLAAEHHRVLMELMYGPSLGDPKPDVDPSGG